MKCFRRCLLPLLCLVLWFGVSLPSVSAAADDNTSEYQFTEFTFFITPNGEYSFGRYTVFKVGDGEQINESPTISIDKNTAKLNGAFMRKHIVIDNLDGQIIARPGTKTTITLENVYVSNRIASLNYSGVYDYDPYQVHFVAYYDNATSEVFAGSVTGSSSDFEKNVTVEFEPRGNVERIEFILFSSISEEMEYIPSSDSYVDIYAYNGEWKGDGRHKLTVDPSSEEAGLLRGIFNLITEKFNNLFQQITELPGKIWEFIENGLKELFVPDEDYIVDYKNRWETTLGQKLGAVWQVVDVTLESWDTINSNDEQNTINLPLVSIPLPGDNEFSFGGYDVKIVPEGFEFLASVCKMACGVFCTLMFINGIRKRYDEVMGVEQ